MLSIAYNKSTTTPVPNAFLDLWMGSMGKAEVKVYLYLIRRTLGFQKSKDDISLSQFCTGMRDSRGKVLNRGTGLNRRTVIQALKNLESQGLIASENHPKNPMRSKTYYLAGQIGSLFATDEARKAGRRPRKRT